MTADIRTFSKQMFSSDAQPPSIDGPSLIATEQVLMTHGPALMPLIRKIRDSALGEETVGAAGEGHASFRQYPVDLGRESVEEILETLYRVARESSSSPAVLASLISVWIDVDRALRQREYDNLASAQR